MYADTITELILDLQHCNLQKINAQDINNYVSEVCKLLKIERLGKPKIWEDNSNTPHLKGVGILQITTSRSIVIHALEHTKSVLINILVFKEFDTTFIKQFSMTYFEAKEARTTVLNRKTHTNNF